MMRDAKREAAIMRYAMPLQYDLGYHDKPSFSFIKIELIVLVYCY
jgi:hypothetical protein